MSGSVIVAGARTPIGRLLGGLKDLSAADLGGVAIKGALEKAGVSGDQVDYVIMGQVIQAGAGQITARQAAVKGGIPMTVPVDHHQQGLPVRHQRDRAGRPADPRRRARDRRRRRHGVDDPRPAPAAEVPRGLQVRRHRRWSTRWPTTRSTTSSPTRRWSTSPRRATPPAPTSPARSRTRSPPAPTSAPPRPGRTASSTTRSCRSRSRSARATRRGHRQDEGIRGDTTAESLGQAAPGLRQGRHHHRRLRLADLRRRLRGRRDEQGQGRGARPRRGSPRSAPPARSPAPTRPCSCSRPTRSRRPPTRRASRSPTSTCSRSTRRSPRSASSPPASSASTRTRSTSTAAPSRSATRSACPAPASCCTSRSS